MLPRAFAIKEKHHSKLWAILSWKECDRENADAMSHQWATVQSVLAFVGIHFQGEPHVMDS